MISKITRTGWAGVLDTLGLALLTVAAFTFVAGFAAAGVACLLLSWRYAS